MPSPRFERGAPGLGILCSIHLSYEGTSVVTLMMPRGKLQGCTLDEPVALGDGDGLLTNRGTPSCSGTR